MDTYNGQTRNYNGRVREEGRKEALYIYIYNIYIYIYVYIYMCVCVYIYIYTLLATGGGAPTGGGFPGRKNEGQQGESEGRK